MIRFFVYFPDNLISMLLLILSIFTLAVLLERFYALYHEAGSRERMRIRAALVSGADLAALFSGMASRSNLALRRLYESDSDREEELSGLAEELLLDLSLLLKRRLGLLGTVSTVAPLLGLLGTVTGMIKSFHAFASPETGGDLLMRGIDGALGTTAFGLLLGIPALIFYNLFAERVHRLLSETEVLQRRIVSLKSVGGSGEEGDRGSRAMVSHQGSLSVPDAEEEGEGAGR